MSVLSFQEVEVLHIVIMMCMIFAMSIFFCGNCNLDHVFSALTYCLLSLLARDLRGNENLIMNGTFGPDMYQLKM